MGKQANAAKPGHARTRIVLFRVSEEDYRRLKERAVRAGARTVSAYVRAAVLTGREFELPSWEHLRDLRNDVIACTAKINSSPPGKARDEALAIAVLALDRISKF